VRLLRNRRNSGKGFSVHAGLRAARHPHALFTDADLAFTTDSYRRVAETLAQGSPFVVGSRRLRQSQILVRFEALGYASRRHLVGVTFNRLVRLLTRLPYRDTQCGLKAFDRSVGLELFRHVRDQGFLFDIELLIWAREVGVPVTEIPVCVVYEDSRSSIAVAISGWEMALGLIGIWRRMRRGGQCSPVPEPELARRALLTEELAPATVSERTGTGP
jgi:dolichyl-phosphate beta-glucosyltransferase